MSGVPSVLGRATARAPEHPYSDPVSFAEVADRVWVARYDQFDVNVTLVAGDRGLLVVDTHASAAAARGVVQDVRRLGAGDVTGIVNTHWHFDHCFGNGTFRAAYGALPVLAHETAAAELAQWGDEAMRKHGVEDTEIVPPDRTFSSALVLDLGDRLVELVHPGRGHTGGDLVVRVPDADVLLAGDLVEESAPPSFGGDCWPMDWPLTLDVVLGLATPATVVVPGHGAPVDRAFVEEQRNTIGIVAETVRDLAGRGVPLDQALDAGDWPWPRDGLADAVRRGYEQLPRSQRRLPLI
jgi:glyoxylase-like metal-dependent hydrolase (beta-lactamase superfamily II)